MPWIAWGGPGTRTPLATGLGCTTGHDFCCGIYINYRLGMWLVWDLVNMHPCSCVGCHSSPVHCVCSSGYCVPTKPWW